MNNLAAFGLDEISLLDIIFINIYPTYLTNVRATCKLFHSRINSLIPKLYQRWVVDLPLNIIKQDTEQWKFKDLIICSLTMSPVPDSMKLKRKDELIINALSKGYSEDECLQYMRVYLDMNYRGRHNMSKILYLSYKRGYKLITNLFRDSRWDIYHKLFSSLFEGTAFQLEDIGDESEVIENLLYHPLMSIDEYMFLLKLCLTAQPESHIGFKLGLEAALFDENEVNCYYLIGYFLTLHVERTKLVNYLSSMNIVATIPGNKTFVEFFNNHTIDLYNDLDSVINTPGYLNSLCTYRPEK